MVPESILILIGRLHPVALHLPIGFVIALFLLEFFKPTSDSESFGRIRNFLLSFAAFFALVSVITGLVLAEEGGYNADRLNLHKWLGIVFAGVLVVARLTTRVLKSKPKAMASAYRGLLLCATGLMFVGAHQGGSLTHGSDYLTEGFKTKERPRRASANAEAETGAREESFSPEAAVDFQTQIFPILEEKCFSCHDEEKHKGELRLDSPDWIRKGGEYGAVVIPGDAEDSSLYFMTTFPEDDPDFMPQKGEGLTDEEKRLLKTWINQGARFGDGKDEIMETEKSVPTEEPLAENDSDASTAVDTGASIRELLHRNVADIALREG